jgi:hypothetical protein
VKFAGAIVAACALGGCPTRFPHDALVLDSGFFDSQPWDPRVPTVGPGNGAPSCASESVIPVNGDDGVAFHEGRTWRVRVETRGRRNDLHVDCVDRDSSEAVLRYQVPPREADGTEVRAIRVSTIAPATLFDTVLAVRNDCGPEYRDYSCNNDGFEDDGRETRRSTVYFTDLEPEQYVFIILDGYDGSAGLAEISVVEFTDVGVQGAPCGPIPPQLARDPLGPLDGSRCPHAGLQCRPGAAADGTDLCLPLLPLGAPCDAEERRNVCEPPQTRGVVCAQNPMDRTQAVCALPGTAAGATCNRNEPRCGGRLACSPGSGFNNRDVCVPVRSDGASCDPAPVGFTNRCDAGLTCCGDSPDAGASFYCRPMGTSPCYQPAPPPTP